MSLASLLSKVSETILSSAVSKLLKGAGLSLFTYGATQGAFSLAVSTIQSYWGTLGNVLYVVGLSGFDPFSYKHLTLPRKRECEM
ncbi:DUF2523 domain-containing protein, partial [Acinetobacter baumannii]|nr:DUF2523 domain-containing protein [Acinetobacter baumannii]